MKWLKRLLGLLLLGIFLASAGLGVIYLYVAPSLPDVSALKEVQLQTPMRVLSADGELISQFGEKRRIPLSLDEIPLKMRQAFLATEDSRFYQHPGIDPIGITRAVVNLISTGRKSQGASTITQQVARNFFLSREKTYIRKIKEIFLALKIEQQLSKDEILELYLNKISLGYRAHGVGAAAQVYYGKTVNNLTLAQIAVIAGLPKAPSTLNPLHSPERAMERRHVVLKRMLDMGFIDQSSYEEANQAPITAEYHGAKITLPAPYLAEMVRQDLIDRFGDNALTMGLNVYTTVHSKRQRAADQALRDNLIDYDQRHGFRGAIEKLWQGEQLPADPDTMNQKLSQMPDYGPLRAAIITQVTETQASAMIKDGQEIQLNWDGLKWARRFITDQKQGPAPTLATEILTAGDIVWVQAEGDGYRLSQLPDASAATVAINPYDGAIEAISGGFSFNRSKFNRVTQAKRQVGSNIKPFIYSAALAQGMTLASIINDAPINKWDESTGVAWRPKNSPPIYAGPIRLRVALAQSKNVVSVRLLRKVGIPGAIDYLSRFGFAPNELPRNETLSLGSASLSPLQVVTAFATFANGGFLVDPYYIDRIEDAEGNILYQSLPKLACDECTSEPSDTQLSLDALLNRPGDIRKQCTGSYISSAQLAPRIITKENAFLVSQAMHSAIYGGGSWSHQTGWNGTGWRAARELHRKDIYGKTGTTNSAKDAWFSGFTPHLVATSWLGFDDFDRELGTAETNDNLGDDQESGDEFGAKTAQPAWIKFMQVALENVPDEPLSIPPGIVTARIDLTSGLLSNRTDYTSRFEYFEKGTEPTTYSQSQASSINSQAQDDLF
jgi:penicillin-binding protein 1A